MYILPRPMLTLREKTAIDVYKRQDLNRKIAAIAAKSGKTVDDCIALALRDYIDNYEDVYKTDLCSVDSLELSLIHI